MRLRAHAATCVVMALTSGCLATSNNVKPAETAAVAAFVSDANSRHPPKRLTALLDPTAWSAGRRSALAATISNKLPPARRWSVVVVRRPKPGRVVATVRSQYGTMIRATFDRGRSSEHLSAVRLRTVQPDWPSDWASVDRALRPLAPRVSVYAGRITAAGCRPVHTLEPDRRMPLASIFKLYVLGAVGRAVRDGRATWSEKLALDPAVRSISSLASEGLPDGAEKTLAQWATDMISVSDNTATDLLVRRVGRAAVEGAQSEMGMVDPTANTPFLTTREAFVLKSDQRVKERYAALPAPERRAVLSDIASRPLPSVPFGDHDTTSTIEWFATAADVCRAHANLVRLAAEPGLEPIRAALTVNNGSVSDELAWKSVAFKGGSEPGVLTLSYDVVDHAGTAWALVVRSPHD